MIRNAAILLILYAASMLCYGSLEMTHDVMHYLAAHQLSSIHNHSHPQHHNIHDHEHTHSHDHPQHVHSASDADTTAEDETLPSLINLFLFVQQRPEFTFGNEPLKKSQLSEVTSGITSSYSTPHHLHPNVQGQRTSHCPDNTYRHCKVVV